MWQESWKYQSRNFFFLNKTVVKILMALVGKVDSMQEQINDISRNKNFKKE